MWAPLVKCDQAGEEDGRIKLSDQRLEGGQRARHGMDRQDVANPQGGERSEAEIEKLGNWRLAKLG